MKTKYLLLLCLSLSFIFCGCKDDFLNKKPSSSILLPNRLEDLKGLLENYTLLNLTPGLPQLSADEYTIVDEQAFSSLSDPVMRNAYTWAEDLYEGKEKVLDWNVPYTQVFYANSILEVLAANTYTDKGEADRVKGWALFLRGHAFFQLVQNFAPAYIETTAALDLGIPLKLKAVADEIVHRSTIAESYAQVITDLEWAAPLLPAKVPAQNKNRPSRPAAFALLARVYLTMGLYEAAERYADSTLMLHDALIDYNTISTTATTPFSYNADEVIYSTCQVIAYSSTTAYNNSPAIAVNQERIDKYDPDDLRPAIFFLKNRLGNYNMRRGYVGGGSYPFTGLATDEVYLIKAECQARRGDAVGACAVLDKLREHRYRAGAYQALDPDRETDVLATVLEERQKELIWRGLRWGDIKRLNAEGAHIVLTRTVGQQSFTLQPNDPKYVFPIPDSEIALSHIEQNPR